MRWSFLACILMVSGAIALLQRAVRDDSMRLDRNRALKATAPAVVPFKNARRRVGPPRAGHIGLRACRWDRRA